MSLNNNPLKVKKCPTLVYQIFIGGDIREAKNFLARMAAKKGMCVSVDETEFIYSGGREIGMNVRIINYPRFPTSEADMLDFSYLVAQELMNELGQSSCSIVGPETTHWLSRRDE